MTMKYYLVVYILLTIILGIYLLKVCLFTGLVNINDESIRNRLDSDSEITGGSQNISHFMAATRKLDNDIVDVDEFGPLHKILCIKSQNQSGEWGWKFKFDVNKLGNINPFDILLTFMRRCELNKLEMDCSIFSLPAVDNDNADYKFIST